MMAAVGYAKGTPIAGGGGMSYFGTAPRTAPTSAPASVGKPVIGGGLNFGSVPNGPLDYNTAYSNALNLNAQNYGNILSGYQQAAQAQQAGQQNIIGGYNQLSQNVLAGIQGVGASQKQAIADAYAQQAGSSKQGLIDRGLYNTTVNDSVQRGLLYDKQKADTGLANQMAQLTAGYQAQLGLAGLGYQGQAAAANTALTGKQLDWMNSVNAPYPNAAAYGNLALQAGQANAVPQLAGAALNAQKGVPTAFQYGKDASGKPLPGFGLDGAGRAVPLSNYSGAGNSGMTVAPQNAQEQLQQQIAAAVPVNQGLPRGIPAGVAPAPEPGAPAPIGAAPAYGLGRGYVPNYFAPGSMNVTGAIDPGSGAYFGGSPLGNFPSDYQTQLQQQQAAQNYQIQAAQEAQYGSLLSGSNDPFDYTLEQLHELGYL